MERFFRKQLLRALVVACAAVVLAQFIPVERTNPPVGSEIQAPPDVRAILRRSCYDCHSHETVWPWYSHVAPMSWLVSHDVHEARGKLNFSAWNRYSSSEQAENVEHVWEEVEKGDMPLWYYLPLHRNAVLSPADRDVLRMWAVHPPAR